MRTRHTPEEIDTALLVLILTGRNSVVAASRLKDEGIDVNARTLRGWREKIHANRYAELEHQHAPQIERQMMSQSRAIATAANIATLEAIEASRKQVAAGEAKDPSTVARNLAVTMGVATDKSLVLDGRPDRIIGSNDIQGLMERMAQLLGTPAIDSTAVEYEAPALEERAYPNSPRRTASE